MSKNINIVTNKNIVKKHQLNAVRHGISQIAKDIAMLSREADSVSAEAIDKLRPKIAKTIYRMSIAYSMITDLRTQGPYNCTAYNAEGGN